MNNIKKQLKFLSAYRRIHASVFRAKDVVSEDVLARMQGYTQLRTDYVLQENWPIHSSGIDIDDYDQMGSTRYVVATTGLRVVAGMRLSPVRLPEYSLSYHMWDNALNRQDFLNQYSQNASEITKRPGEQYFDVTRLVTEASILSSVNPDTKYASRAGMMKILALSASVHDPGKTPVWIFTTTEGVLRFMQRNHFDAAIIAEGKISEGDKYKSYLCVVRPHDVIRRLKQNQPLLYFIANHQGRKLVQ